MALDLGAEGPSGEGGGLGGSKHVVGYESKTMSGKDAAKLFSH